MNQSFHIPLTSSADNIDLLNLNRLKITMFCSRIIQSSQLDLTLERAFACLASGTVDRLIESPPIHERASHVI